ncbi:acyltransferase [Pantoea piersonii]|uniref:N-acetyltransferase n=1 Tax=Pantoea piersonii TaxID=2364647 RepID=A0AAJ5QNQ0_9GAMM|nr:acyltransferase [Pantoea piersonii]WBG92934.1 N-acetyltransferase [Pantoea piersonii]
MQIMESGIHHVKEGNNVKIVTPVNIYGCELGDDVFIGPFVEIQKGCVIGSRTRIQSHTFICENVRTGSDCFIGHGVMFANDLFKNGAPDPSPDGWITIVLGDGVSIGSGATILTSEICSGAVIGAGSVVTKPVLIKGIYAGNPAKLLRPL